MKCRTSTTAVAISGKRNATFKDTPLVLRQPNNGATPINARIKRPIGVIQRL